MQMSIGIFLKRSINIQEAIPFSYNLWFAKMLLFMILRFFFVSIVVKMFIFIHSGNNFISSPINCNFILMI